MASGIWSGHSTSPARPVDQRARDTFRSSDRSVRVPDCRSETERSAYPVDLAVSRETCSALRWYSVSTVRTPLHRLLRHPHAPMRRRRSHNPSEGVKPPAAWLRAEHRRSAHAIRCTTDFCSSRRNARGTLASYSSLGDGRDGTSPGGGPRIPFPHTRMNPGSIDVTPPAESKRELSSATYGGFT